MSTEKTTAATTSETKKMISLRTMDGETFEIEETVAMQSQTIKNMIEDGCADNTIPLSNVTSAVLVKVIEYCKKHVSPKEYSAGEKTNDDLTEWDKDYIDLDTDTLYDVMMTANNMKIKELLDLSCQKVADMIKDMTPEEVRHTFKIKNDFTPEEEDAIRNKNPWAFQ